MKEKEKLKNHKVNQEIKDKPWFEDEEDDFEENDW